MDYVAASKFTGLKAPSTVLLPAAEVAQPAPLAGIVLFDKASTYRQLRGFRPLRGWVQEVRAWHITDALLSDEFIVHRGGEVFVGSSIHCFLPDQVEPTRTQLAARLAALPLAVDERYAQETALVFHNEGGRTWGHFLIQLLPRSIAFLQSFPAGKLAVPSTHLRETSPFGAALKEFGIGADKLLPLEPDCTYSFRELVIADLPYDMPAQLPHPAILSWLGPGAANVPTGRPVFISRSGGRRLVANASDLAGVLARYGIEVLEQGSRSFAEQVKLWRQAPLVIATLGSDLANLVFAAPGTPLLVLSPDWFGDLFFYNLAQLWGMRWHELRCGRRGEVRTPEHCSDFFVDIEHFETLLRSVLPSGVVDRFAPVTVEERERIFALVIAQARKQAVPRRVLVGEPGEVWTALAPLGFTLIRPDALGADGVVTLFASAEMLVLLEGAGLYEARYCAPGTPVVIVGKANPVGYLESLDLRHIVPGEDGLASAVQDALGL